MPSAHLCSVSLLQLFGRRVRIVQALEPSGPRFDSCFATDIQGIRGIHVSTLRFNLLSFLKKTVNASLPVTMMKIWIQ